MGVRGICIACGLCGGVLRRQGELRGISISPFAPLTPTPLKTSRDTLHPETGVTSLTIALRGTSEGWDYEFADHKKCRGASQKREVQKPQVSGGVWGKAPKRRKA